MFELHTQFNCPPDDTVIWRYLSFTKFASILDRKSLYFCRTDLLGDPYEGSYPKANLPLRDEYFKKMGFSPTLVNTLLADSRQSRKQMYVNCWHANPIESDAMWKLYTFDRQSSEGVAIRSTIGKLKESFGSTPEAVFIGAISYIDYNRAIWHSEVYNPDTGEKWPAIHHGGGFCAILHKRQAFEHEREIRAVVWKPPIINGKIDLGFDGMEPGLTIKADPEQFIEEVYIAPSAGSWLKELTVNIIKKYDYSFPVMHSELAAAPIF